MRRPGYYSRLPPCGCFVIVQRQRRWLPLVHVDIRASLLSSSSRTVLTQTFTNPNAASPLTEVCYDFPLYDGVSVVGFVCTVGERVIRGVVKERQAAANAYDDAVARGETAGLLQRNLAVSDIFTTKLGNVPAGANVTITITYLGELEHDAQADGLRLTIPTSIAPRYDDGQTLGVSQGRSLAGGDLSVTVDVEMADGCSITSVQSPSHPISVRIGHTSDGAAEAASPQRASASLALASAHLDKDVVVQVVADGLSNPEALLEEHATLPHRRALMMTLVPKFSLRVEKPEVVFVCDRSGSMGDGKKMANLVAALQLFLKSLPVGVRFNVCSFGSRFEFLWDRSRLYDSQEALDAAVEHVKSFEADLGGTDIYAPMEEAFKRRYADMNLEVFLLTDGEIWNQDELFALVSKYVGETKGAVRVFTLGVGDDASSALIQGAARAGNGFAQMVADDEKMDKKVIRMLKGALTPHVTDYALEVRYGAAAEGGGDDFEVVDKVMDALCLAADGEAAPPPPPKGQAAAKEPISLFDASTMDSDMEMPAAGATADDNSDDLPAVPSPRYLQAPFKVPALFPFSRTTVYVMLSEATPMQQPTSVVLTGTSAQGRLRLEIAVTALAAKGTTIHQLAARKAVQELEEGKGWLAHARDAEGKTLKDKYEGQFASMVRREAVALGVEFQVGGKWCSFVAVQDGRAGGGEAKEKGGQGEAVGEFEVLCLDKEQEGQAMMPQRLMASPAGPRMGMMASRSGPMMMRRHVAASPAPAAAVPTGVSLLGSAPPGPKKLAGSKTARGGGSSAGDEARHSESDDGEPEEDKSRSRRRGAKALGELASLQTFTGSWRWSAELERVLGVTEAEAANKVPGVQGEALATLCALAYLGEKLAADKEAWELMADKAEEWLEAETGEARSDLAARVETAALFARGAEAST